MFRLASRAPGMQDHNEGGIEGYNEGLGRGIRKGEGDGRAGGCSGVLREPVEGGEKTS
jgi:hypothetical protein